MTPRTAMGARHSDHRGGTGNPTGYGHAAPLPATYRACMVSMSSLATEGLRNALAGTISDLLTDGEGPRFAEPSADDPGPIPLDSPVRVVHGDTSGFIGGVRALLYQTLHPDACYAVHRHSVYEDDPIGRLQRTGYFLGATVFGSGTEAQQAIDVVNAIHSRISGTLPDGRTYRADDPHLVGWVHVTEVDSFLDAYRRFGPAPISDRDADQYVADMRIIGEALGARDLPANQAELADSLAGYRTECRRTPESEDITRFIFAPQLPLAALSFYPLIFGAAAASLPGWARRMLMLPVLPGANSLLLRPAGSLLTRTLRWASPQELTGNHS